MQIVKKNTIIKHRYSENPASLGKKVIFKFREKKFILYLWILLFYTKIFYFFAIIIFNIGVINPFI